MQLRSQSAMEYLMTYGWAILVIAVVLAALFNLGVFNQAANAPKAGVGSCQVYRPNGPGTTASFINLEGSCLNLQPNFVAQFNGQPTTNIQTSSSIPALSTLTITSWVYVSSNGGSGNIGSTVSTPVCGPEWANPTGGATFPVQWDGCGCPGLSGQCLTRASISPPTNQWIMLVFEMVGSTGTITSYAFTPSQTYSGSGSYGIPITTNPGRLIFGGYAVGYDSSLNGSLSNVQLYNTTLSLAQLQALYKEGIGGDPITLQNLMGWWPLNGNSNDYSGNNDNGADTNIAYTSVWQSGYTHP